MPSPRHIKNHGESNIPTEDPLIDEVQADLMDGSPEFGSIDQRFYDCQSSLTSESEDDFYSIRDDSLSSGSMSSRRGIGSPSLNKTTSGLEPERCPEKKERLVELLQDPFWSNMVESTDTNNDGLESEPANVDQSHKFSINKTLRWVSKKRMTGFHCGCIPRPRLVQGRKKGSNLTQNPRTCT